LQVGGDGLVEVCVDGGVCTGGEVERFGAICICLVGGDAVRYERVRGEMLSKSTCVSGEEKRREDLDWRRT
jgi:hypothetical protein